LKWDTKFPTIAKSWRSNWARVIPFFAHPPEIQMKAHGSFPNNEGLHNDFESNQRQASFIQKSETAMDMRILFYLFPFSIIAIALAQWRRTSLLYGGIKYDTIKLWGKKNIGDVHLWLGVGLMLSSPFTLAYDFGPPILVEVGFLCGVFTLLFSFLPPTFLLLGVSNPETGRLRSLLHEVRPSLKSLSALNPWVVQEDHSNNLRSNEERAWFPHIVELTGMCPIIVIDIRASSTQLRRELAFVLKQPNARKTIFLGRSSDPYINRLMEHVEGSRRAYDEAEFVQKIKMITNSKEDLLSFYRTPVDRRTSSLKDKTSSATNFKNEGQYWAELLFAVEVEMSHIFSAVIPSPDKIEVLSNRGEKIYRFKSATPDGLDDSVLLAQVTSEAERKVQDVVNSFEGGSEDHDGMGQAKLDALSVEEILESIRLWEMRRLSEMREICPICGELFTLKAGSCLNDIRQRVELLLKKRDAGTAQVLLELLDKVVQIAKLPPAVKHASERYLAEWIRCCSHAEFQQDLELEREIAHAQSHLIQPAFQANNVVKVLNQTLMAMGIQSRNRMVL
jgi:hypothetical protein